MSYFNEEQQDYMRSLGRIPREQRCKCGWYLKGECTHSACVKAYEAELRQQLTEVTNECERLKEQLVASTELLAIREEQLQEMLHSEGQKQLADQIERPDRTVTSGADCSVAINANMSSQIDYRQLYERADDHGDELEEQLAEARDKLTTTSCALDIALAMQEESEKHLAEAQAECERLREALPPAEKLKFLAAWLDVYDDKHGGGGRDAQLDLRNWADRISAALAKPSKEGE